MDEVYVSLECTAKLHFKGPQRPVEHRCRLTLGANREQNGTSSCFITVEGDACQRRKFKVTKETIHNLAPRLGDGCMTIVFRNNCCDSLVVKEAIDRSALTRCYNILNSIWMGVGEEGGGGGRMKLSVTPSGPGGQVAQASNGRGGQSASRSGKKKLQLAKRFGATRGEKMLEAAQSKPATALSFYKSGSPVVASSEPFLPQTTPTTSPYFQRVARRNLAVELSGERGARVGGSAGDSNSAPAQDRSGGREHSLGPRKAAILARKRLPLEDLHEQSQTTILNDILSAAEPLSNGEGFANLGNTCYMNAVLQALLGLEPFAEDLLNFQLIKSVHPHSLCRIMYLLLKSKRAKDTYDSQKILLKKIKSAIASSRPKFSGYRQQDAHELLTQCLDQLKEDSQPVSHHKTEELEKTAELCPVVRNFECEMRRSITCKSCNKVTEVSEKIYDFALQLPESVLLRANEQANLQDLMDGFFVSEEVEYKCPVCECNSATMACRLARLPRVLILFLKRYGYNTDLSRNSKRIDFIRIPRFIRIGHLCCEKTEPPCEYQGPWPRDPAISISSSENKENHPALGRPIGKIPLRNLPPESSPPSAPSLTNGDNGILGKRRSSDQLRGGAEEMSDDVIKKPKMEQISNSNSVGCDKPMDTSLCRSADNTINSSVAGSCGSSVVNSGTSVVGSLVVSGNSSASVASSSSVDSNGSILLNYDTTVVANGTSVANGGDGGSVADGSSTVNSASPVVGGNGVESPGEAALDPESRVNSVSRDIVAEFDALFSPEVIFDFENKSLFTASALPATTAAMTTESTTTVTSSTSRIVVTTPALLPMATIARTTAGDSALSAAALSEKPLPIPTGVEEEASSARGNSINPSTRGSSVAATNGGEGPAAAQSEGAESVWGDSKREEEEEEELRRAMEESMREQSNDMVLLQQMGLSEEEQLKLALELSMQEQSPVEEETAPRSVEEPSSEVTSEPPQRRTPTPDTHQPETYKLMGIVSHIGKASSGGHYISDVCSVGEGVWHSYNDCHVNEVREEDIRQRRQATGYIFFYMHKSVLGSVRCSGKGTS